MAVVKYDTMINLAPDTWLTTTPDEPEDDVDEYGRLVIDISDPVNNADNATEKGTESTTNGYTNIELRGDQPTSVTENETTSSTKNMANNKWNLHQKEPLRLNRDIPIKLLLKRSFQIDRNKPHKKRLKEYEHEENLECNNNQKELLLPKHENNTEESPQNLITNTATKLPEKPNTLKQSIVTHIEELISSRKQYFKKLETQEKNNEQIQIANVNQGISQQNGMESECLEKQNNLKTIRNTEEKELIRKHNSYRSTIIQTGLNPVKNSVNQRTKDYNRNLFPIGPQDKSNFNQSVDPAIINTYKNYLNQVQHKTIVDRHTVDNNLSAVIPTHLENAVNENNNSLKRTTKGHRDYTMTIHKPYLNQEEIYRRTDIRALNDNQRIPPPNSKENNERTVIFDGRNSITPDQGYHSPDLENKQRISVVSNDFLFKQRRSRGRPRTNNLPRKTSDQRNCPQFYQEALIDFMEQRYQIALRENIPLTVTRKPTNQEPLQETKLTEVIHVDHSNNPGNINKNSPPGQQKSSPTLANQYENSSIENIAKNTPVATQKPLNPENQSYNILVHRGPDINRIVITIADENSEKNKTAEQSFYGDQRVPDSVTKIPYPEASPPIPRRRSYYYKEPSLRSFRKRLPQRTQRQTRNTYAKNRYEQTEHLSHYANEAYGLNYSYLNHYEIPTPVFENCYAVGQEYSSPVTHIARPWEANGPVASDRIARRAISSKANVESSKKQYNTIPLNLSLKPLTVDERSSYPVMYPHNPLSVQEYY